MKWPYQATPAAGDEAQSGPCESAAMPTRVATHVPSAAIKPASSSRASSGAANERARRVRATLEATGGTIGASVDQVALAWLLRHPARVLPVMGTGKIERLREAAAAESVTLDRQQWFMIWEASAGREVP